MQKDDWQKEIQSRFQLSILYNPNSFFTLHFENSVLRHFFAITLNLLLNSLLVVFVRGADHHSLALETCKQAHLPLLAWSRQVSLWGGGRGRDQLCCDFTHICKMMWSHSVPAPYMIQDVVPLLAGSDLDKLSQEKRCSLGNGSQFCDVLRLAFQAVDLY